MRTNRQWTRAEATTWRDRIEVAAMRAIGAAGLLVAAVEWSDSPRWAKRFAPDEGGGARFVPWTITFFLTLVISIAAATVGPSSTRGRVAWAAMIGVSIFVANRHSLPWAAGVTGVAMWAIATAAVWYDTD
jgi:hypothetical protein